MSKERELLERWFSEFGKIHADIKLLRDTQTLLAQPEQTEQEPVVWNGSYMKSLMDEVDRLNEELLSLAPTREPLSVDRLAQLYALNVLNDPIIFARQVEMAHGIGAEL